MHALLTIAALIGAQRAGEISFNHRVPKSIPAYRAFVVSGQMQGSSEVEHAEIRHRMKGDSPFERAELEVTQADSYEGSVPAERVRPGTLEYYVVAFDFVGKSREVFASAKKPQRLTVDDAPEPEPYVPSGPSQTNGPTGAAQNVSAPSGASGANATGPSGRSEPRGEATSEPVRLQAATASDERLSFSAAELDALGVLTLADVLERFTDVQVSRAIDGSYRVSHAGVRDNAAVLVLLDGQPLTSLSAGAPDLRLPIRIYERVELAFGVKEATELSAPLVVVRLTSRRQTLDARALAGGYLSHTTGDGSRTIGSYDAALSGGAAGQTISAYGRAGVHYSGGAQLGVAKDALSDTGPSLTPGLTNDRAFRLQLGGSLEAALSREHKLGVDADFIRFDHGAYAGSYDIFAPTGGTQSNQARLQLYAEGRLQSLSYRASLGYRLFQSQRDSTLAPPGYATDDKNGDGKPEQFPAGVLERLNTMEHAIDADAGVQAQLGPSHRLSARATLTQYLLPQALLQRNATVAGAATSDLGAQDLPQPTTTARSAVLIGVADHITPARAVDIDLGVRFVLMSDIGVQGGDVPALLTPVGGISLRPTDGLLFRLSYDTGVRAPTLAERSALPTFEDRGVIGNAALRYMAARTAAFDASYGGEYRLTESRGERGTLRYRAELRGYYTGTRGAIVALDQDGSGTRLTDAEAVDTGGLAAYLRIGFLGKSYVRGGTQWQRAVAHVNGIVGSSLLTDTPQLSAVIVACLELGGWAELSVSGVYYAERRSNARSVAERLQPWTIPATTVVHVQLRTRAFSGVRFIGLLNNAFDVSRQDDSPRPDRLPGMVPREGMRAMAGLEFSLDELRAQGASK